MLFLYVMITIALCAGSYTAARVALSCGTKVKQLTAPEAEKRDVELKRMKKKLKKVEDNHQFLKDRFGLDFSGPGNTGNDEILRALLNARKQLVCANFNISAYNKSTDPKLCAEMVEGFEGHLTVARHLLNDISKIWNDEYCKKN